MASLMDLQLLRSPFPVESDGNSLGPLSQKLFVLLIELGFISISNSLDVLRDEGSHRQPDLPDLLNGNQQWPVPWSYFYQHLSLRNPVQGF